MRILMLTQWFQPEPNFKGLPLAKALIDRGHEVEVLTGFPNYPGGRLYPGYRVRPWRREVMEGVRILRAPLYPSHDQSALKRIANYVSFAVSSALLALAVRKPDVVYVYCPPVTAAAGAIALKALRAVPYVIDVQDLWPDTLTSTGMVREGAILRMVSWFSGFALRNASRLIVLSPGFRTRLVERGITQPVDVIPNWAPPEIVAQRDALALSPPDPAAFTVLFAGNMGHAQALHTVLDAAALLAAEAPNVRFVMIGGGILAEDLARAVDRRQLTNITMLPLRPAAEMGIIFAQADALLVHLRDDPLFAITIPSKTQAYLAVGKPILMGVRGDASTMVEDAGAGLTFEPENPRAMADAVLDLSRMEPAQREEIGANCKSYYDEKLNFDLGVMRIDGALTAAAGNC